VYILIKDTVLNYYKANLITQSLVKTPDSSNASLSRSN